MLPQPDEIIYDRRRKRLMIQVLPGGKVVLKAPLGNPKNSSTVFGTACRLDCREANSHGESRGASSGTPFRARGLLWAGRPMTIPPYTSAGKGPKELFFKQVQGFFLASGEQKNGAEKAESLLP